MKIRNSKFDLKRKGRPRKINFWKPLFTIFLFITVISLVGYQTRVAQVKTAEASQAVVVKSQLEQERDKALKELEHWKINFELEVEKTFTDKKAEDWKQFKLMVRSVAPIYDIPEQSVKVAISQAALESARGTSQISQERNNFFGYTCYDGREYESCTYFASAYESIIEYFRLIKNDRRYAKAYAVRHNPEAMIREIKAAGYATDPNYVTKIMSLKEWSE